MNRYPFILFSFLLLLLLGACSKLCNSGYEGTRCNELAVAKFEGTWMAVDSPGNITYTDTITAGRAINDISLSAAFGGHRYGHAIAASVLEGVITIPYQQPDTGYNFIQGTGTLSNSNNQIIFTYQIITGDSASQIITNYTGNWTRIN